MLLIRNLSYGAAALMLVGCNKLMPMPIGGTNLTKPQTSQTIPFVGAGQSNMEHEHLGDTFTNYINVAVGGTYISQWQKGTPLYAATLDAIRDRPGAALLFWQGEAEGIYPSCLPWAAPFTAMIRNLRQDAGYEIKVVYVQIGQVHHEIYPSTPQWSVVQAEQSSVSIPNVVMVSAADMMPAGDSLHYSQAQYDTIQRRMYQAYLGLLDN